MEACKSNMLAIIEQTDLEHDCYKNNTAQFFMLMLLKVCLDVGAMYLCYLKPLRSFLNMCSVSIVLVDLKLVIFMSATLWLDVHTSHTALCFIMAHFSAAYSALPVPMFFLGILDYYLQWTGRICFKLVRNAVLIFLIWAIAGMYAHATVNSKLQEQERSARYLICEIQESQLVAYSVFALTTLMFFVLLPYLPRIPQWVNEAERISEAREEMTEVKTSDRLNTATEDITCTKEDFAMPRPSMHISIILAFGVFWIPYLAATMLCIVLEYGVPAYISVNLLWVQCLNSLLAGTVFWLGSDTVGPYSTLPDNVCLWQVYWHLSTGTEVNQQLPVTVFNPSKGKRSTAYYV